MKHFLTTSLIFAVVLAITFISTSFILERKALAQSGLTETSYSSQNIIAQQITIQLDRLDQLTTKLNDSIFTNPVFQSLEDYSQPLPEEQPGRENPFAPIGQ